ncbi:MAG TPA: histidine kinase [Jiangellales bacterium]|nr:histidine kinase [Jiangellales bacterium]
MADRGAAVPEEVGASPPARGWVVACAGTGVALVLATAAGALAAGMTWRTFLDAYVMSNLVIGLALLASGAPIAWFTRNMVGWLFVASGLGHLATAAATAVELYGLGAGWPLPVLETLSTVSTGAWQVGIGVLFPLAVLLFPDGRLPSRWWAPVAWLIVASGGFHVVSGVISTGSVLDEGVDSILSTGRDVPHELESAVGTVGSVVWLLAIAALVVRYVRGEERTRRQLMWLVLALLVVTVLNWQRLTTGDGPVVFLLSALLVPVSIAIAVVRHELLDIRLVLSRTLLYGLTLAVVVAGYAGLVAAASLIVSAAEPAVPIGAAIVVAICFTPVRLALTRVIDRAFHGTRSDPARTARRVGEHMRHDDDLAGVLTQTRAALRLPWLALRRVPDGLELTVAGNPDGSPSAEIPLSYRGEVVGALVVGLRRGERELHHADRRTLELIATPVAVALHALTLTEQVRLARAATVEAGAAERVRLQRELHDGLGPTLTSVTFRADAASNLIRTDVEGAQRLLSEVRTDLRAALDDVRQVVYGLRPIELDDLGLVGALRQRLAALPGESRRGVAVELHVSDRLPLLSPAVELAAFRIVSEAVANVLRHSDARRCRVSLSADDDLVVRVGDDGTRPQAWHPGVGLRSVSERAEELGGSATAGPTVEGWEVVARLPRQHIASSGAVPLVPEQPTPAQP